MRAVPARLRPWRSLPTYPLRARLAALLADRRRLAVYLVLAAIVLAAGFGLGWRAVQRHQALLTNAEDLGFTDQVLWNFLRGQFFRLSTYQDAEFSTDIDLKAVRRPDSLLAFHVEPILLPLAPLYLILPDVRAILWLQGFAIALGAIPAYRLARRRLGHPLAGLAFAAVYLLAPLGQWAAAADFHSVALAAPLLLLAIDALDADQPRLFLVAELLAASTKEEIGLLVAGLGALMVARPTPSPRPGSGPHPPAPSPSPSAGSPTMGPHRCAGSPRPLPSGLPASRGEGERRSGVCCTHTPPCQNCQNAKTPRSVQPRRRRLAGLTAIVAGAGWSALCVAAIIPYYSGGAISPFTARYAELGGSPDAALRTLVEHPDAYLMALGRPEVLGYAATLLLAGGWLGLLAPELLLVASPALALNVLSSSPWMAAGRAHYSASVLPFLVAAAIVGGGRLAALVFRLTSRRAEKPASASRERLPLSRARERGPGGGRATGMPGGQGSRGRAAPRAAEGPHGRHPHGRPPGGEGWLPGRAVALISSLAVLGAAVAYHQAGIGPLVDALPAPTVLPRHELGRQLAASIPAQASISASSDLYPHLSQRAGAYLFPTVHDADFVLVDVAGSSYPAAPGGIYERLTGLLTGGEYRLLAAEDGFVLLKRGPAAEQPLPDRFFDFARITETVDGAPIAALDDGAIELLTVRLVPSSEVGPRGPLATLETVWRVRRAVPERPRPELTVAFRDGTHQTFGDLPVLWWYPPERWRVGETVRLDVPALPFREVVGWTADAPLDPPEASPALTPRPPLPQAGEGETMQGGSPSPPRRGGGRGEGHLPGEEHPAPAEALLARIGGLTARLERDPWCLTLLDGRGQVVWQDAPAAAGALGPFAYVDRAGHSWQLTRLLDATPLDDGLRLTAATDAPDGRTATVELHAVGEHGARISFTPNDPVSVTSVGGGIVAAPGEHFLGFGERFGGVDQRGRVVRTWAEDRRDVGFGDATYAPIPWYISSRGYGLLVESDARGSFDVAAGHADRVAWTLEQPSVSLLVLTGPTPREILQDLVKLDGVGRPPLPPIWAFSTWKTAVGGSDQVLRDAERVRAEGLPVSALLIYDLVDEPTLLGWPFVDFGNRVSGTYPNARALTDRLHALGFKVLGYKNADVPPTANVPPELLVRDADGHPFLHPHHHVGWVDFTNPAAISRWGGLWRRILGQTGDQNGGDLGFDGAMLDLGELVPAEARYADGTAGPETHNRYLGLYARASFEAARAVRGDDAVLFARSASRGARPYQSLQWSGDQTISWDQEGIRGLVPAALSLGLSGFPYWHPEVGGYAGIGLPRPSERELWMRWLQLGALSPLLRDNYGDHRGDPVEVWSDAETIATFRRYARLHDSLVPYLYTQARVASETGLPIVRHLVLTAPDDPRAWTVEDEYTLGDDLLVAPVLEQGARLRTIYLPAGSWVDWWTGRTWEGGQVVSVEAPLDQIPILVRAGTILPLATDADTLAPATEGATVWNGDLVVRVVGAAGGAPPPASQQLYDGTRFSTSVEGGRLTLVVDGTPLSRSYQLVLPAPARPSRVLRDGQDAAGWTFEDGAVRLTVPAATDFQVTVEP